MTRAVNGRPKPALSRVFIVDDHPLFRRGLAQMVDSEQDLAVCGEAGDARQALRAIPGAQPALVLVDISMPGGNGLQLVRHLRADNPQLKLLVVSMHDQALYAARALRAGGDGYVMKQESPDEILRAMRDVLAGHVYVSEAVLASPCQIAVKPPPSARARVLDNLSDAELEILEFVGRGESNRQIAVHVRSTTRAVTFCRSRLRKKLALKNPHDLLRYAIRWVETGVIT